MHGQPFSSDSQSRWQSIMQVAQALSLEVPNDLIIQLDKDLNTPELGYPVIHQLLLRRRDFTAVLCFNDISAIGSIRALHDAELKVPTDVSVLGFDDIQAASYIVPSLTTIRQPLKQMGAMAASSLLKKLTHEKLPDIIKVDPELVVRESTAQARTVTRRPAS
jgi:LacI family transcriptional regulator